MYKTFYGLSEKPFSITPDPKFFFQSDSHRGALELLHQGVRYKDGFIVITGDIGTGKTTLCRALLQSLNEKVFTALILNPFLSEDDLLKVILQDFGVLSPEAKREISGASKQDLIELLNQYLLNTLSIGGNALLIVDESQNLPLPTLEQIRILSNLETNKEKLLQIILVGQLGLVEILRSEQLRQLDQRIASRYQIGPLSVPEIPRYILHRLMIAGSKGNIRFDAGALNLIRQYSQGLPRLINLLCDRALLSGCAARSHVITKEMVKKAAEALDLPGASRNYPYKLKGEGSWTGSRRTLTVAFASIFVIITVLALWSYMSPAAGFIGISSGEDMKGSVRADGDETARRPPEPTPVPLPRREKPKVKSIADTASLFEGKQFKKVPGYPYTLHLGSSQTIEPVRKTLAELESLGYRPYVATVDLGGKGIWNRLLVGRFRSKENARRMADELKEYGDFPYIQITTADWALNR